MFGSFELAVDGSGQLFDVSPPPYIEYMCFGMIEFIFNKRGEAEPIFRGSFYIDDTHGSS